MYVSKPYFAASELFFQRLEFAISFKIVDALTYSYGDFANFYGMPLAHIQFFLLAVSFLVLLSRFFSGKFEVLLQIFISSTAISLIETVSGGAGDMLQQGVLLTFFRVFVASACFGVFANLFLKGNIFDSQHEAETIHNLIMDIFPFLIRVFAMRFIASCNTSEKFFIPGIFSLCYSISRHLSAAEKKRDPETSLGFFLHFLDIFSARLFSAFLYFEIGTLFGQRVLPTCVATAGILTWLYGMHDGAGGDYFEPYRGFFALYLSQTIAGAFDPLLLSEQFLCCALFAAIALAWYVFLDFCAAVPWPAYVAVIGLCGACSNVLIFIAASGGPSAFGIHQIFHFYVIFCILSMFKPIKVTNFSNEQQIIVHDFYLL